MLSILMLIDLQNLPAVHQSLSQIILRHVVLVPLGDQFQLFRLCVDKKRIVILTEDMSIVPTETFFKVIVC